MEILESEFLKNWREKLGVSQKRFAELAQVSLTTLRQFEIGSHKPQRNTLKKLTEVVRGIEGGLLGEETIRPQRKRRKDAKRAPEMEAIPLAVEAVTAIPKRRGRPPRQHPAPVQPMAAQAFPPKIPAPVEVVKPATTPAPAPDPVAAANLGVIQLSNLDLELINRVLNMTGKEKLALLAQLM